MLPMGNYQATSNTVIELEFSSNSQGQIHGIGFELLFSSNPPIPLTQGLTYTPLAINDRISSSVSKGFQLYGTQNWEMTDFKNYMSGSQTYVIPIGHYYQGSFNHLIMVADDDINSNNQSVFSNIKVYEQSSSTTELHYYINDHLGTPQQITDQSNQVSWSANYTAFGEARLSVQQIINPHRFPGQYFDQETGLHYNWHRYYDPETGRYITSDPIGLQGGINTYGYVYQNPLSFYDTEGLQTGFRYGGRFPGSRFFSDMFENEFPEGPPTASAVAKAANQCLTCVAVGQAQTAGADLFLHASDLAKAAVRNGGKKALGVLGMMSDIQCSVECF